MTTIRASEQLNDRKDLWTCVDVYVLYECDLSPNMGPKLTCRV